MCQDSSVNIVTRQGAGRSGFRVRTGGRDVCLFRNVLADFSSVLGVKRPGRGVNHSPTSSIEVKNEWNYTSTSLYAFMACGRTRSTVLGETRRTITPSIRKIRLGSCTQNYNTVEPLITDNAGEFKFCPL
jgi:hypothetical protein